MPNIFQWINAAPADHCALFYHDKVLTYGALKRLLELRVRQLSSYGLKVGDLVSIEIKNPAEHWFATLACFAMGLSTRAHSLGATGGDGLTPALWIVDQKHENLGGSKQWNISDSLEEVHEGPTVHLFNPMRVYRYFPTSGTTGLPKTVELSLHTLNLRVEARVAYSPPRGVGLLMMPVDSVAGLVHSLAYLKMGLPQIFDADAADVLIAMQRYKVSEIFASPAQIHSVTLLAIKQGLQLETDRILVTGALLTTQQFSGVKSHFKGAAVVAVWGASEVGFVASKIVDRSEDLGAFGRLSEGVDIEIVDERGLVLGANQTGFMRIKTPYMANRYVGTSQVIAGQWFCPGDLGQRNEDQGLQFVGRVDEVVNLDGVKVNLLAIDAVLLAQTQVQDAASFVLSRPDGLKEVWGVVQLIDGGQLEQVFKQVIQKLPAMQRPKRLLPVAFIPRTYSGKPQRQLVAEKIASVLYGNTH